MGLVGVFRAVPCHERLAFLLRARPAVIEGCSITDGSGCGLAAGAAAQDLSEVSLRLERVYNNKL